MKFDAIRAMAEQLTELHNQTISYRQEWQATTKPLLIKVLGEIRQEINPASWFVQQVTQVENWENINIQFFSKPSGIKGDEPYLIEGAGLAFSQTPKGSVASIVHYPFINGLISRKASFISVIVPPKLVTEDFIRVQVENFLDEMIKWEKSDLPPERLGF